MKPSSQLCIVTTALKDTKSQVIGEVIFSDDIQHFYMLLIQYQTCSHCIALGVLVYFTGNFSIIS